MRFELASRTGAYLNSGTQQRIANAFPALGVDTFGRAQQYVNVDKAFIQFAGLTAGRAASFYDFYAHDFEIIGTSLGSDVSSTNLLAYTATFGDGFSATISIEDPIFRKNPLFGTATAGNAASQFAVFTAAAANLSPVVVTNSAGVPIGEAFYDLRQTSRMPDFVGALRYDAAWGSAQLSAAVHELNAQNASSVLTFGGTAIAAGSVVAPRVNTEYGWAIQGGLKFQPAVHRRRRRSVPPGFVRRGRPALHRLLPVHRHLHRQRRQHPGWRRSRPTSPTPPSTPSRARWSCRPAGRSSVRTCTTGRPSGGRRSSAATARCRSARPAARCSAA